MSAWWWHPPHLVDNTDTQYLGDHDWQQCRCFRFTVSFASICLPMCHSVCVSVHLFRINLKFLKTHNYWIAQLLYVSLFPGLELKLPECTYQDAEEFFQKIMGEALVSGFGTKQPLSQLNILIVVVIIMSVALR